MRGWVTWVAILAGIVLLVLVTAAIGNRDESGETVSAGKWAQNVCGAVGVWRGELEATVEDGRPPTSAAQALVVERRGLLCPGCMGAIEAAFADRQA